MEILILPLYLKDIRGLMWALSNILCLALSQEDNLQRKARLDSDSSSIKASLCLAKLALEGILNPSITMHESPQIQPACFGASPHWVLVCHHSSDLTSRADATSISHLWW